MKFAILISVLCASCAATSSEPPRREAPQSVDNHQRVSIYLGQRELNEDDWAPLEDQLSFALEYAREESDTMGWEIGLAGSGDSETVLGIDLDVTMSEFYGGVVRSFRSEDSSARPYIGGGLTFITAEIKAPGTSVDDSVLAGYVHAGITVDVSDSFYVGLDIRKVLGADVEYFGAEGDADYLQAAVVFGWGF